MSEVDDLKKKIQEYESNEKKKVFFEQFMKTEDAKILPIELVKKLITTDETITNENIAMLKEVVIGPLDELTKYSKKNPWSKEYFNLSVQGEILKKNSKMAKRLKEEAE